MDHPTMTAKWKANSATALFSPHKTLDSLAESEPTVAQAMLFCALPLGIIPPTAAFAGATVFGWRFGAGEAVILSPAVALAVSCAYFIALLLGFAAAAVCVFKLARAYGAENASIGKSCALVAVVGAPLMAGGILHLFPLAPLNVAALIPAAMWSVALLYRGLPIVFAVGPERGMLMASATLGGFLVGLAALLAATMILWVNGIGPDLGFN